MRDLDEVQMRMELAILCETSTQKEVADSFDLSPQFINDVIAGRRNVTDELASRMGYERVVVFRRKRR